LKKSRAMARCSTYIGIIVLISNLLADNFVNIMEKKVKNELKHKIESNNVNFTTEKIALRDISLSMKENTVTALMDHQDVVNQRICVY
jgi:hypothetical protein